MNGRTTYQGYHFVNGRLLSESPLKDHPLNPMTDPDLVRWLQFQTTRRVALASLPDIRKGVSALKTRFETLQQEGMNYIVTDAIVQEDIAVIAKATRHWPLISGGSGITAEIARLMQPTGIVPDWKKQASHTPKIVLVISGSCSPTTFTQLEYARDVGFSVVPIDPRSVLDGTFEAEKTALELRILLSKGQSVVLYASSPRTRIEEMQEYGRTLGMTVTETGERISEALAETARIVLLEKHVGRLIVSGGETSGAVCRIAGLRALEVGLPVDPGVPYCFPLDHPRSARGAEVR